MIVNGKAMALKILDNLTERAISLNKKGIVPHLYILLLTDDPATLAYIKQKIYYASKIGAKITVDRKDPNTSTEELLKIVESLNENREINGIILQRPTPEGIDSNTIEEAILPEKEVDGFTKKSEYAVPVASAVEKILKMIYEKFFLNVTFEEWLLANNIVVIGKGESAGKPIIDNLNSLGIEPVIIDSQTENKDDLLKNADIVISAVGKNNIINPTSLKENSIVIGVGIFRGEDGLMHGDYNEKEIAQIASYYTPTPGGVGPLNVACLMENLILATEKTIN